MEVLLSQRWWDNCFRLIDEDPIFGNNIDHLLNGWLDQKDSRIQGVEGSSEMLKNYRKLIVW
jgi:hypothetical protein